MGGFGEVDYTRRTFVKRFLAVAFVTPMIVSFGLDSMAGAVPTVGNQTCANQTFPNQTFPNQLDTDRDKRGHDPHDPHRPHCHDDFRFSF